MKIVFKAKSKNGVVVIPKNLTRDHIVLDVSDSGRLGRNSNSVIFISLVLRHLRAVGFESGRELYLCALPANVHAEVGFLTAVTIDLGCV